MVASKNEENGLWTLQGVEAWGHTLDRMCKMLINMEPFKFARYGDGEFFCMQGKVGRNGDKHEYFPELGSRLNSAFRDAEYIVGIQPLSVSGGIFKRIGYTPPTIVNADVLHNASITGTLKYFLDSLDYDKTILVGPKHLLNFNYHGVNNFHGCHHIVIPDINCWLHYKRVKSEIEDMIFACPSATFLLCASMMSEVLIDDFSEDKITMIDIGSVFDPYCNRLTRTYHHKLRLNGH